MMEWRESGGGRRGGGHVSAFHSVPVGRWSFPIEDALRHNPRSQLRGSISWESGPSLIGRWDLQRTGAARLPRCDPKPTTFLLCFISSSHFLTLNLRVAQGCRFVLFSVVTSC